jgi:glycine/D-amino acid oxidase-like deaminating enzyme
VKSGPPPWTIIGQGLAGTCLAWEFWQLGVPFRLVDRGTGGSSRVAAGLINPVTGKNFEPSPRIADFLPEAMAFYAAVEERTGTTVWHPLPVLRLAASEKEWRKMTAKSAVPEVARWLAHGGQPVAARGWAGAFELTGGGRLDTRAFLTSSQEFFQQAGITLHAEIPTDSPPEHRIWCEGAAGLITGRYGPHRCAKGEILTIRAPRIDPSHIRIGAGGWLVPIGGQSFKAGSTYEWDDLNEIPTAHGRSRVEELIRRLGGDENFDVLAHEAGIRPILRRSEPLIGPLPGGGWMFNGLGSKGSLYAPGMARRLARWICRGSEPEPEWDFRNFTPDHH